MLNEIERKITEMQKAYKPYSPVFCVGEQLKDICRTNPSARELVNRDLDIPEFHIEKIEAKIEEFAKENEGCTPPHKAHRIICEFFGIPLADVQTHIAAPLCHSEPVKESQPLKKVNVLDFI